MKAASSKFGPFSLCIMGIILPGFIYINRVYLRFDWYYFNDSLFNVILETTAFCSISAALIIFIVNISSDSPTTGELLRRQRSYIPWMSASLISMGALIGFTSSLRENDAHFLWADLLAQTLAGVFALGVWLPKKWSEKRFVKWAVPISGLALGTSLGVFLVVSDPILFPLSDGYYFSKSYSTALALSGFMFLGATFFFVGKPDRRTSDIVFAHYTLLSGISDFMGSNLHLWGPIWWSWHILQLIALLIIFVYFFLLFFRMEKSLQASEAKLERIASELKRSNQDLEQLAQLASHDLKEPLRMITAYLSLLKEKLGDQLDSQGKTYLEFARDGAARMKDRIEALLKYAQFSQEKMQTHICPTSKILEQAILDLDFMIKESKATIQYSKLPVVKADPNQLLRVFENLIQNSIKYRTAEPPHIHICAQDEGGFWRFEFFDNGIGIPKGQEKRIFNLFIRGPNQQKNKGYGIGLAACKTIIERHGGRIGTLNRANGAYFYFLLPKSSTQ